MTDNKILYSMLATLISFSLSWPCFSGGNNDADVLYLLHRGHTGTETKIVVPREKIEKLSRDCTQFFDKTKHNFDLIHPDAYQDLALYIFKTSQFGKNSLEVSTEVFWDFSFRNNSRDMAFDRSEDLKKRSLVLISDMHNVCISVVKTTRDIYNSGCYDILKQSDGGEYFSLDRPGYIRYKQGQLFCSLLRQQLYATTITADTLIEILNRISKTVNEEPDIIHLCEQMQGKTRSKIIFLKDDAILYSFHDVLPWLNSDMSKLGQTDLRHWHHFFGKLKTIQVSAIIFEHLNHPDILRGSDYESFQSLVNALQQESLYAPGKTHDGRIYKFISEEDINSHPYNVRYMALATMSYRQFKSGCYDKSMIISKAGNLTTDPHLCFIQVNTQQYARFKKYQHLLKTIIEQFNEVILTDDKIECIEDENIETKRKYLLQQILPKLKEGEKEFCLESLHLNLKNLVENLYKGGVKRIFSRPYYTL